ncbi:MAG: hypothetical protein KAX44_05135, partial [Candidatus Brocadiae bacterium]|nr:hypothetical protein [Candidatus Brocadiia bacterium]
SAADAQGPDGQPSDLPEGTGLAGNYPGDIGIDADPAVLLAESFETGTIGDLAERWSDISNRDGQVMAFSSDVPPASSGRRSLEVTATLGKDTGGHLYTRLRRGVDRAFARFYVKFPPDAGYIHHFVHLGGYNPSTPWPQGGAGERPRGDDRMTAGIEPFGGNGRFPPPGAWGFYVYWHEMKVSADGKYWGNGLRPARPAPVPRNRWQCVEIMLKCNSEPDRPDGELALWLDGELTAHFLRGAPRSQWTGMGFRLLDDNGEAFEGFRWRTSDELKVNFFWLLHYVTENSVRRNRVRYPNPTNRVLFDDIVVAATYIGPVKSQGD